MIFLTFGTGMGAGLILGGRLYSGTCGMAGEIGHVRIAPFGPTGYGKLGSFEGFCSGGGIKQLGQTLARETLQCGRSTSFCASYDEMDQISARSLAIAANEGDAVALRVWQTVAEKFVGRVGAILPVVQAVFLQKSFHFLPGHQQHRANQVVTCRGDASQAL